MEHCRAKDRAAAQGSRYLVLALMGIGYLAVPGDWTPSAYASDPAAGDVSETVRVTGVGVTEDLARRSGWAQAVSQVVGTLVKSETVVQNEHLIKDEILAYSDGFVDHSTPISTRVDDGLTYVEMDVSVRKQGLRDRLVALHVVDGKLDGGSIGATVHTQLDAVAQARAAILDAVAPFRQGSHVTVARVGEMQLLPSPAGGRVRVGAKIVVDADAVKASNTRLAALLAGIATSHGSTVYSFPVSGQSSGGPNLGAALFQDRSSVVWLSTSRRPATGGFPVEWYSIPEGMFTGKGTDAQTTGVFAPPELDVVARLLDGTGSALVEGRAQFTGPGPGAPYIYVLYDSRGRHRPEGEVSLTWEASFELPVTPEQATRVTSWQISIEPDVSRGNIDNKYLVSFDPA